MRKPIPIAIAAALSACGAAITSGDNAADASQGSRRSVKHRPDPNAGLQDARDMASWDEGGAPGCVNSSVAGRERAVAQRLGAGACANAPERSAPVTGAALSRPWLVGTWVLAENACNSSATYLRLSGDGHYQGTQNGGDWRLAGGRITFIFRDMSGAEYATADMERSAPLRTNTRLISRVGADRINLNGMAWRRCSPDPDFYLN